MAKKSLPARLKHAILERRWQVHFTWNDDYTIIIGLTPTGCATVEALKLNREGLVNLRRLLYSIGEHPPLDRQE